MIIIHTSIVKTWLSLCLIACLIPLSSCHLSAQTQEKIKPIQFSCLVWKQLPYPDLYYRQGKEFLPVKMQLNQRSQLYPMKGQKKLQLYIPKKTTDNKIPYQLVGQTNILPNTKRQLYLILETPEGARLPLKIIALDDSLKSLPPGSFQFINFTKIPLGIKFNKKRNIIKPKSTTLISNGVAKGGGFLPFTIINNEGKELFGTRLYSQRKSRDMVFILPHRKVSGQLRIKFLSQVVHPKNTEKKQAR